MNQQNRMHDTGAFDDILERVLAFLQEPLPSQPTEKVSADFNELALRLFQLQFATIDVYQRYCRAQDRTPDQVASWDEIPALPTAAFKDFAVTSLPPDDRPFVFESSGTTLGRGGLHFHNQRSIALYEASALRWFEDQVLMRRHQEPAATPLGRAAARTASTEATRFTLLFLTPTPAAAPRSSLLHMFETIRRRHGDDTSAFLGSAEEGAGWRLDFATALARLADAEATGRPVMLLGTAFSFVHLLDYLRHSHRRLRLPRGSSLLETGGYKGRSRELTRAEFYAELHAFLGLPASGIISEYGMCELSSQAYGFGEANATSAQEAHTLKFPPWCRARVISPETGREVHPGEVGLVRLCDLANVRSVLAVETQDLARRTQDGLQLLGRAPRSEPRGCSLLPALHDPLGWSHP